VTRSSMRLVAPVLAGLALAQAGPCGAQAVDQKPVDQKPVDQKPAATAPAQIVPEDTAPGRSGSSQESLGKKLNRTDGVLHPPQGIDPGVALPPPSTGSNMPVIPPPGTPGGNSAIEPK
jgi:hypothetical protein